MVDTEFSLRAIPPFRLDFTAWAIRRRPENRIDLWDGVTYKRVLCLGGKAVQIRVTQGGLASSRLRVTIAGVDLDSSGKADIILALDRLLGRRIDLRPFYSFAAQDPRLGHLVQKFYGVKPPRFPTVFETCCERSCMPTTQLGRWNHSAQSPLRSLGSTIPRT
jgi:DNA-3-methyladenine glycosylase II